MDMTAMIAPILQTFGSKLSGLIAKESLKNNGELQMEVKNEY